MSSPQLTRVLQAVAAHGLIHELQDLPDQPLDQTSWTELSLHIRMQRMSPLLTRAVVDGQLPATYAQIQEALDVDTQALARVLVLEATLVRLAEVLEHAGVRFRVLKGPAVAHLDYPDPAWRDFGDLDLLIHPDDLDRTITVLADYGYVRRFPEPRAGFDRRFTKSVSMANADGLEFDLHRTFAPGLFGLRVQVAMLWDTPPERFRLGGRTLDALAAEERLIHACYHASLGNVPPRLVPLRDVAQLLLDGKVDATRVRKLAAAWQGEGVVAQAITMAWRAFGLTDTVELSRWAEQYEPGTRERRDLERATSPGYTYVAQAVDGVRAIRNPRDRLAYVSALAFPGRRYVSGRHSGFTARLRHAVSELVGARTKTKEPQ